MAPYAGDFAPFDGREQLGLHREREVADFVEQQRSARRHLHSSGLGTAGVGEGALFVAEEFPFEKIFRDTAHVDADKGSSGARRILRQQAGNDVFARAVLAGKKDVGVRLCELVDERQDAHHGRRPADDRRCLFAVGGAECFHFCFEVFRLALRLPEPAGCRQGGQQLFVLPRFRHEVCGAHLDGAHRLVRVGVGCHHHHCCGRVGVENGFQGVETLLPADGVAAEVHVEQYDVGREGLHEVRDTLWRLADPDRRSPVSQKEIEGKEHVAVVVDDEYFSQ